eukprot:2093860-Pyramimonas_sp.AAC.1
MGQLLFSDDFAEVNDALMIGKLPQSSATRNMAVDFNRLQAARAPSAEPSLAWPAGLLQVILTQRRSSLPLRSTHP